MNKGILFLSVFISKASLACPELVRNSSLYKTSCLDAVYEVYERSCGEKLKKKDNEKAQFLKAVSKSSTLYKDLEGFDKIDNLNISTAKELAVLDIFNKKDLLKCIEGEYINFLCFKTWKSESKKLILDKVRQSSTYKTAFNQLEQNLQENLAKFKEMTQKKWSYELEANNSSVDGLNAILDKLKNNPLSGESAQKMIESLNTLAPLANRPKVLGTEDIEAFGAGYLTVFKDRSTNNEISKRQVLVTDDFVLASLNSKNKPFLDFIFMHELAHVYSKKSSWIDNNFSFKSQTNILDSHRACLYTDKGEKDDFEEDLADMIAARLTLNEGASFNPADFFESYCFVTSLYERTDEGHEGSEKRLFNIVKHSKTLQQHLKCQVKESVCHINMEGK